MLQLLSSAVSLTRYKVDGRIAEPFMETVRNGLKKYRIKEIENDPVHKSVGWTCADQPYRPDFDASNICFGTFLVFSIRIDKKPIQAKVTNKEVNLAIAKRLAETGRDRISRNEKRDIKDNVLHRLCIRMPATPNIFDVVWNYDANDLWFFSNQKEANEELETLFHKSFLARLIRIFPYTAAELAPWISNTERDCLHKITQTTFNGGQNA